MNRRVSGREGEMVTEIEKEKGERGSRSVPERKVIPNIE